MKMLVWNICQVQQTESTLNVQTSILGLQDHALYVKTVWSYVNRVFNSKYNLRFKSQTENDINT